MCDAVSRPLEQAVSTVQEEAADVPHVVIIGGGFAGIAAARGLAQARVRITMIDRRNHHLFQPLLYQVATASLSPANIAQPIRTMLRGQRNVQVRLGEVLRIDTDRHAVELKDRGDEVHYDYLIVAAGATENYFGHPQWAKHAIGLKSLEDATHIRSRFLEALETADVERDPLERRSLLTFVIVGGGTTGVELAGALAEVGNSFLHSDYPELRDQRLHVILLQGGDRLLPDFPEDLSARARERLERLGVEVRTHAHVSDVAEGEIRIGEERVEAQVVLWAAGVRGSALGKTLGVALDKHGRVPVKPDLSLPGHPEVLVAGDLAALPDVPGVAPAAMQMGAHAARMVHASLRRKPRSPFRYRDKGSLATIGRAAAVAQFGRLHVSGPLAWAVWLLVHILYLAGFQNRLLVLIQWAASWIFWRQGARIITAPPPPDPDLMPWAKPEQPVHESATESPLV
ncbi:MAG: NAD(P)/FAD-dependent oxidoreductase [Candidatus Xenobia bacterium]